MPRRSLVIPVAVAALLVAGCSSPPDPKTDPPPTRSAASTTATTAATTAGAGPGATPTPGTVPVDQIPPGRPATWIPAGMPTVAPWKEPGDLMPKFSLAMFRADTSGAVATVTYYIRALNWALATLAPASFLIVCDAASCKSNAERLLGNRARGEHVIAGRATLDGLGGIPAASAALSRVTIRATTALHAGRLVDRTNKTISAQAAGELMLDITLGWSGRMWRISNVVWVPR